MHIGWGTWASKTECVFFPPPQFFYFYHSHSQEHEAAIMTIQRAFCFWCTHAGCSSTIAAQPALRWNCPPDFPIGCHVTVALSHYMHTGRDETICLHNWKGVIFKPDEHSPDIICIPTKSLAAYHPNKSKHDQLIWQWWITQSRADGIWSPNLQSIDQLDKTKNFPVADGFVGFTRMFWYLGFGSLISYNLREDDNITARIVATNTSRDAQKVVWHNPHLDLQSHSNELAPSYPQET
jgi:hypothetical protein